MGARSARSKAGRGRGEVVPISDEDDQDQTYSPLDKPHRRESYHAPTPRRRVLITRGWLGFFLLLNIVAIAGFIFSSAWYFPATSTSGVVEQVIKQGDVSLLELPPRNEPRGNDVVESEQQRGSVEPTTTMLPTTQMPVSQPTTPPNQQSQEPTTRLRSKTESATIKMNPVTVGAAGVTTASPSVEMKSPLSDGDGRGTSESQLTNPANENVKDTIDLFAPKAGFETQQPLEKTPLTPEATLSVPVLRSQSMEELLRRMKGAESATVLPKEQEATPAVTIKPEDELVHEGAQAAATDMLEEEDILEDVQTEQPLPAEDEGMEGNLVVWLKADAGVEIVDTVECEALGTACEVTSWKSVIRSGSSSEPIVFQPVDPRMRPVLQPASQNELPMVSFACGMVHTSGFILHDMMTIFFVLSPSQIEAGDTYRAQKFFGNAPYGQFLMHGGRPAFFTASGLVESSITVNNDQLVLVAYRLHRHAVEIKVGNLAWSPKQADEDGFQLRLSGNAALSLGNVKGVCDTNAFQGRIAEVLIYETVLSDQRAEAVEQYLRQKWWGESQPSPTKRPEPDSTKHTQEDPDELVVEPTSGIQADVTEEELPSAQDRFDPDEPQMTEQPRFEETDQPPEDLQPMNPRTFDPEGVFEWLPSTELLALIAKEQGSDPSPLVEKWKQAVSDKVASVRSFQFGSDILRTFIRERRDELLTLREELFGG